MLECESPLCTLSSRTPLCHEYASHYDALLMAANVLASVSGRKPTGVLESSNGHSSYLPRKQQDLSSLLHHKRKLSSAHDPDTNSAFSHSSRSPGITSSVHEQHACQPGSKQPRITSPVISIELPSDERALPDGLSPEDFLVSALRERGYEKSEWFLASCVDRGFFCKPTIQQIEDYDLVAGKAVRFGNINELGRLRSEGRRLDACNKFGESLVHLACRTGNADVVKFLVQNGGNLTHCDDLGRIGLHDVCWATTTPQWDVVRIFIEADHTLLLAADNRGWTPLRYIRRQDWPEWRDFLEKVLIQCWPTLVHSAPVATERGE